MKTKCIDQLPEGVFSLFVWGKDRQLKLFSSPIKIIVYYKNKKIDLLRDSVEKSSLANLDQELKAFKLKSIENDTYSVWHFFYELGHFYQNQTSLIKENDMLAIEIKYSKESDFVFKNKMKLDPLTIKKKVPSYKNYQKAFEYGRTRLLYGDCYQFNLTFPIELNILNFFGQKNKLELFLANLWSEQGKRGGYGQVTSLPQIGKIFFGNSPECLFNIIPYSKNKFQIITRPIKGSWPCEIGEEEKIKQILGTDKKNINELNMITDLMSNDLAKIKNRGNSKVYKKLDFLRVPRILHLYAEIATFLDQNDSIGDILEAIFPGGSITGAPKKRVMNIINVIENGPRGLYTGSTLLTYKLNHFCNINIRSGYIDLFKKRIVYGAGGGITLKSNPKDEYNEMILKVDSFLSLFTSTD